MKKITAARVKLILKRLDIDETYSDYDDLFEVTLSFSLTPGVSERDVSDFALDTYNAMNSGCQEHS